MKFARLGDTVALRHVPEISWTGTLVAWSDPENVWVRWDGQGEELVAVDELAVLVTA